MAFPLSVFEAVRREVPDFVVLGIRVSATDWIPGGGFIQVDASSG